MVEFDGFLKDLALVLVTAAVVAVVFQRLRQPVVLGYLLAGLVIGPHVPLPLFADVQSVGTLAELGVTLLMFSIGLEFSLRKLIDLGAAAVFIVALETALLFWLGFSSARLFGFGTEESACIGAIVAIASTMVVAKLLGERSADPRIREFVFGILVVEDLVSMLLLALLTALMSGVGLTAGEFVVSSLKLGAFLAALVAGGLVIVPRLLRWVMATGNREVTLLAAVGVCFGFALLAERAGYSIALGAFCAGTLAAEAGHARILEPMVRPVRDIFAAIFFVAVGMMIDPAVVLEHLPLAIVLTLVIVVGKIGGLSVGGVLAGHGLGKSVRSALWLLPVGEYGFLVAEVGRGAGERGAELHSIAAALCVITVVLEPLWLNRSERVAAALEHRVSPRVAVFETLHATWIESLGRRKVEGRRAEIRRILAWLGLDALLIIAVIVGVSLWMAPLEHWLIEAFELEAVVAQGLLVGAALVCSAPFCIGILRGSRRLAAVLSEQALPSAGSGAADMALAPRRTLYAAVQLATLLGLGVPVLAAVQPFVPARAGVALALAAALVTLFVVVRAFRKRVADLDGHFRAGSQVVLESLVRQGRGGLDAVSQVLPGLGTLHSVRVSSRSEAVGRTLAEVDVHARSGATVVCIARGEQGWASPTAAHVLQTGDVVAVTGTEEQVARVETLLGPRKKG